MHTWIIFFFVDVSYRLPFAICVCFAVMYLFQLFLPTAHMNNGQVSGKISMVLCCWWRSIISICEYALQFSRTPTRVSTPSVFARRAKSSESFFLTVQSSRRYGRQDCKQRHDAGTCYGGDLGRFYGGGSTAGTSAVSRCGLNFGSAFLCRACPCRPSLSPRKHGIRSTLLNGKMGGHFTTCQRISVLL